MFQHMTSDHHRPLARWMRLALIAALLGLPLVRSALPAQAAPGARDPSFGSGGIVTTDIGGIYDEAFTLAVQQDGKIVTAGTEFAATRYNSDGSLDSSFGVNGIATIVFSNTQSSSAGDMVIQPDGKIVLAGSVVITQPGDITDTIAFVHNFALVRYTSEGYLDTTFGNGGKVIADFNSYSSGANAVALQLDGKLVVVGYKYDTSSSFESGVLARYNSDGNLDASFGSAGKVTGSGWIKDVIIQPDGKIVAAGSDLARYHSDGSPDYTFGSGGRVAGVYGWFLALQPDGKLVVSWPECGFRVGCYAIWVARYTRWGDLDPTFGGTGRVQVPLSIPPGVLWDIALQMDGKVVVLISEYGPLVLARLTTDGNFDPDFGMHGQIQDYDLAPHAIALQPDGRLVVAGTAGGNFAVARYVGQSFQLAKTVGDSAPDPEQIITYTVMLTNWDVVTATNGIIADILPPGLSLARPITLDPIGIGTVGTPPTLVSNLSLFPGQSVTLTLPVTVSAGLQPGTVLTNLVTFTSTQLTVPVTASVVLTTAAPPVPQPDFALTAKNTPVTLTVLANDYDPNGETFSIATVGMPISGTAATDGLTVVYTPTLNFTGTEVFTYTVSDGRLAADGTITVLVAEEVRRTYLPVIWRP